MSFLFDVFKLAQNGLPALIQSAQSLDAAVTCVIAMRKNFPGEYFIEFGCRFRTSLWLSPRRILIAHDEAAIRRAVRAFIESRSQFEVCEAVDGAEAFHKAVLLNPDLIVLDLSMPNANGVEVALLVRDLLPSTPVVLYTMFDEVFGKSPARTLGIAAIVPKSDGVAELLRRIKALLDAQDALAMQEH